MKKALKFWIKERDNPQLGTYYVSMCQLSKAKARNYEKKTLYGSDMMIPFDNKEAYEKRLAELKAEGKRVH